MIVKEEFLNRLRKIFDLNLYEVRVWTALLSRGVSTAGELSNISDVPRSRTYDILENLEKKGFIQWFYSFCGNSLPACFHTEYDQWPVPSR